MALTLVPMMCSRILTAHNGAVQKRPWFPKHLIAGCLSGLTTIYRFVLHWSIRLKILTLLLVIAAFAGSILLVPSLGDEFISSMDGGSITVELQQAAGVPLNTLRQAALQLEQIIREAAPETESGYISLGSNSGPRSGEANSISLNLKLIAKEERERNDTEIANSLRERLDPMPGVTYTSEQSSGPTTGSSAIEIKIKGHDMEVTQALAEQFRDQMQNIPGLVDIDLAIKESVPQMQVHLDQDVLNDFMLSDTMVAQIVSTAIACTTAGQYREPVTNTILTSNYRRNTGKIGRPWGTY